MILEDDISDRPRKIRARFERFADGITTLASANGARLISHGFFKAVTTRCAGKAVTNPGPLTFHFCVSAHSGRKARHALHQLSLTRATGTHVSYTRRLATLATNTVCSADGGRSTGFSIVLLFGCSCVFFSFLLTVAAAHSTRISNSSTIIDDMAKMTAAEEARSACSGCFRFQDTFALSACKEAGFFAASSNAAYRFNAIRTLSGRTVLAILA